MDNIAKIERLVKNKKQKNSKIIAFLCEQYECAFFKNAVECKNNYNLENLGLKKVELSFLIILATSIIGGSS